MATTAILGFWGVAALLVLTPGADWAYAIAAGAGRRAVS
ncbi:LysE family translocator, partial [Pseudomonas sp. SIMBA_065]